MIRGNNCNRSIWKHRASIPASIAYLHPYQPYNKRRKMPKTTSRYICQQCAASYSKWSGRCEQCGAWNSLLEQAPVSSGSSKVAKSAGRALQMTSLAAASDDDHLRRISSGMPDIDVLLGGGIVPGSVILLAG